MPTLPLSVFYRPTETTIEVFRVLQPGAPGEQLCNFSVEPPGYRLETRIAVAVLKLRVRLPHDLP